LASVPSNGSHPDPHDEMAFMDESLLLLLLLLLLTP
jgi:hypothetical protein